MRCQNCGAELEDGVLFCRECGAKVQITKRFCRECGAKLAEGAKFCSVCGAHTDFIPNTSSVRDGNGFESVSFDEEKHTNGDDSGRFSDISKVRDRIKEQSENIRARGEKLKEQSENLRTRIPNVGSGSKAASKRLLPLAGIVVLLILCVSLPGRRVSSSSKPSSDSSVGTTAETQAPILSDNKIEKGSEYAYMSGEATVYIATAVSDSIIKIERWGKHWLPDKAVKYEEDIGSFKINDPANGFSWIDDEHTAFNITFQDKNHSGMKKARSVVFTIDISDSDICKGTNYNENIRSYLYRCDDWHIYRAIALTEKLIKVERWERSDSFSRTPFLFARDLWFINPDETTTDFEWTDDEHTSFTITIQDEENKYYWKDKTFTVFELENKKAEYETVSDYLNNIKEPVVGNDSRPQKEGFDSSTNETYQFSQYIIEIPSYWVSEQKVSEGIQRYAETGDKVAMLQIEASYDTDEDYPVTFDGLMSDLDEMKKGVESTVFTDGADYEVIDTGYVKGVLFKGSSKNFQKSGLDITGEWFTYASEKDRNWCNLMAVQSDNTEYLYDDDFIKMIYSIRPIDSKSEKSEESVKPEETAEAQTEETTTAPTVPAPTEAPSAPETTATPKANESVSYSTNDKSTVKNGNQGVYAYKSRGGTYDNYYMIDFDEGYVYFFSDGNGDTNADRVKIDSGNLNDVLIITYHDGSDKWSYGFHFKWKNQPDHLILQDQNGFEYDFYSTNLNNARSILAKKKIYDY